MKSKKYNDAYLRRRHGVDSLLQSPQIHGPAHLWSLIYLENISNQLERIIDIMEPVKEGKKEDAEKSE